MIFVVAANEPTMLLMLTEKDIATMRPGATLFVDDRQTQGRPFTKVVLSLHATDVAALAMIRQAGNKVTDDMLVVPEPRGTEDRCEGCDGIMPAHQLNQGRCIVCWRNLAIRAMGERN